MDIALNDARGFLMDLVQMPKEHGNIDNQTIELALKILLVLAVIRRNVEDVLTVCTLLDLPLVAKASPDLRDEIALLIESAGSHVSRKTDDADEEDFVPDDIEDMDEEDFKTHIKISDISKFSSR